MTESSLELQQESENQRRQGKRDKLDLTIELLITCSEPVKTHLLYRTQINHTQLTRYLSFVLKVGMIQETSDPFEGYVITEKGRVMLELFAKARTKPQIVGSLNAKAERYRNNSAQLNYRSRSRSTLESPAIQDLQERVSSETFAGLHTTTIVSI